MKKSKYNKIIELENGKTIAFNSITCALAEVDDEFLNVLKNIENIDIEHLNEKSKELIKNMSTGNYIVDDDIDELKLLKYRNYSGKFSSRDFGIVLAPTLACNFACPYCYETAKAGMMSKEVQDSLIEMIEENAKNKKNINVTWYGGEPLLAKDIIFGFAKRAIEICDRENVNYSSYIVTNGYLINDEIIKGMKESKITGAQITVDGPPSIHNKRRKLKNSDEETFTTIISNIKKLIDNGITNVAIRINIDKTNVDNVEELLDILDENGLKDTSVNLGHVTAYTDACNGVVDNCLDVKEYAENDTKYQKILFDRGYNVSSRYPFYPSIKSNYCCADHIGAFVIDAEGYMYKCWNDVGNVDRAVGNVTKIKDEVNEKMFARNMEYMMWSPFDHEECKECNVLPICMGGCPYKGLMNKKPECEKWIYNLQKTIIDTYNQSQQDEECVATP
jgi:radical SAM additional 4Fe4S-binding domain